MVGVGDGEVSRDPDVVLMTYALGSCIAVMIHDPVARVCGMVHYMLPDSSQSATRAQERPWMFADTGIPLLLSSAMELGANKRRLTIFAAGGAQMMDATGVFNIGKRNCLALRKVLWKAGLIAHVEETGGELARTIRMEVGTGRVWLNEPGGEQREMKVRSPSAQRRPAQEVNHGS